MSGGLLVLVTVNKYLKLGVAKVVHVVRVSRTGSGNGKLNQQLVSVARPTTRPTTRYKHKCGN